MSIKVELKPHTCTKKTAIGEVEVEFDQFLLIVNDRHVGYVGKHAGAHISFITRLPKSITSQIADEVAKIKLESVSPKVADPPSDEEVREVIEELEETNDGDD